MTLSMKTTSPREGQDACGVFLFVMKTGGNN